MLPAAVCNISVYVMLRCLQPLPDALRGEKWAFVQLPLSNLREMMAPVAEVRAGDRAGCRCVACWLLQAVWSCSWKWLAAVLQR